MIHHEEFDAALDNGICCLGCARVVPEDADFCPHCGAPLSATSAIDPYKSIFAEGQMYWRLTHAPMNPVLLIGFSLLIGAFLAGSIFAFVTELALAGSDASRSNAVLLWCLVVIALSLTLLIRAVQNFLRQRRSQKFPPEL